MNGFRSNASNQRPTTSPDLSSIGSPCGHPPLSGVRDLRRADLCYTGILWLIRSVPEQCPNHEYLIGRPKRPTMKSVLIRQVAGLSRLRERASSFGAPGVLNEHFDRQRMIDDIGAVVRVMLVRLDVTARIFGTGQ